MRKTRSSRELFALTEISKTMTLALELPDLLHLILDKIIGVLEPAEIGVIMLWDQSTGLFRPWASIGYHPEIFRNFHLKAGEAITGKVFAAGQARLLSSSSEVSKAMQDMQPENQSIRAKALGTDRLPISTVAVPIEVKNQRYGVLVLETLTGPQVFKKKICLLCKPSLT